MSVLFLAWILACVAAWKTMPNLLSISVFIYRLESGGKEGYKDFGVYSST
jgi:hypothetical protein